MAAALKWVFDRTLNSVWFGVAMMLLVAGYVAVGSGFHQVREFFEMDELAFFNAWPFKLVMVLLVASVVTVTFVRIPFTIPRYGVWMIHTGIVLLIWGMAYYYAFKEEGRAFVMKGDSVSSYYDNWERALYLKVDGRGTGDFLNLPSLPRFKAYPNLSDRRLKGLAPMAVTGSASGGDQLADLHKLLGLDDPIRLDVEGYWPYANISISYPRVEGGVTGMHVDVRDPNGTQVQDLWVVGGSDSDHGDQHVGQLELEHRAVPSEDAAVQMTAGLGKFHTLDVNGESVSLQVGEAFKAAGYDFKVEEFNPAFPAMNGEIVKMITLMVQPPGGAQAFRRQIIFGREKVTDWKLNEPGAGPMGKRQTEPLDAKLITKYTFSDPTNLLPHGEGGEKRLFLTAPTKTWMVSTSLTRAPKVEELAGGKTEMTFGGGAKVIVDRVDGVQRTETVEAVPREKRDRNIGEQGLAQILAVRVSSGTWNKLVFVPYAMWALASPRWEGGTVTLPNGHQLQFALGQRVRPIAPDMRSGNPTSVRLDAFEVKSYDGGTPTGGMQRDFISTLSIRQPDGRSRTGKAFMNNPIYFGGTPGLNFGDSYWTLFQASWDPNGQRFTVLGVGNRPGVWVMTVGAILMTIGLLYAFYAKPLIIAARKRRAIAEAQTKGKLPPSGPASKDPASKPRRPVVIEGVEGRISV